MSIGHHVGMRWALAGLAMTGLAGGVLAATDQPGSAGADTGAESAPPADQGHGPGPQHWRTGGWNAPGGPQARRAGPSDWHRPPMMRGRAGDGLMLDRPLLLSFRRLELTDQQWQRVQAILEVQHLRSGAGDTPEERRAQVAALFDPGDAHHAEAVQAIKDRTVARIDQAAHTQQALYEVLTPAQKTHLQQLVSQRRERIRGRLQQREQGHGGPQGQEAPPAAPAQ